MSLEVKGYLNDYKDILQDQLKDNDTRQTISQALGGFLATGISPLSDASKSVSSFGISIGLGLLGVGLLKKYGKSRTVRSIAKIFGVKVIDLDKRHVLDELKNRDLFVKLQKKLTNALTAGTIDEVERTFADEFDIPLDDAMEVYLQIKDIVLDSVIIGNIMNITDAVNRIETLFGSQTQNIRNALDAELKTYSVNIAKHIEQAIKNVNEGFRKELDNFQLLQSNLRLITLLSLGTREFREGNTNCWIRGDFSFGDIRNGYDARSLNPMGIAFDPANENLYVANFGNNTFSVISGQYNYSTIRPIPVGKKPTDIAYDSANGNLYVTNSNDSSVSVISGQTNNVVGSPIPVGGAPFGIALDSTNGYLYVTNSGDGTVSIITSTP